MAESALSNSIDLDRAVDRRPMREVFFAPFGGGQRHRRGGDGLRVGVGVVLLVVLSIVAHAGATVQAGVTGVVMPPPLGSRWVITTAWFACTIGVLVAVGLAAVLAKTTVLLRDGIVAFGVSLAGAFVYRALLGPTIPSAADAGYTGFSATSVVLLLTTSAAVQLAVAPYLSRGLRRTIRVVITVAAIMAVLHGSGVATAVATSVVLAWTAVAVVHLLVGSPEGLPSIDDVARLFVAIGATVDDLTLQPSRGWGAVRYWGKVGAISVEAVIVGRDATEAQFLSKLGRTIFFRDSGPSLATTSLQQVEHEAFATVMAERSLPGRVPVVVAAGEVGGNAVLLVERPAGERLSVLLDGAVPAGAARSILDAVHVLGSQMAHGAVAPDTVVVSPEGIASLVGFDHAALAPSAERRARDLAAALVCATLACGGAGGVDDAVATAIEVAGEGAVTAALPFLQRAALPSGLGAALKARKGLLAALHSAGAMALGVEPPELYEPRRISWGTIFMTLGSLIGGWALLAVFVHVASSFSTLKSAAWGWVALTFVFAQLCTVAVAGTTLGSVVKPLGFMKVLALEMSNSFSSLAAGNVGVLGTRVRFFQRQGYDATMAVSSAVVSSTASWVAKTVTLGVALPFALGSFHFKAELSTGGATAKVLHTVLLVVVGVGVLLGVVVLVPALRRFAGSKLRPKWDEATGHLRVLAAQPSKLVLIFGGSILAQLLVAVALGSALHAFGAHLSIAECIVALTLGSVLGGLSPVPGGMGVVEAGMILALTAAGIPDSIAVSAVFVQRLFTSYLPPVWGWFTLMAMRKRELL